MHSGLLSSALSGKRSVQLHLKSASLKSLSHPRHVSLQAYTSMTASVQVPHITLLYEPNAVLAVDFNNEVKPRKMHVNSDRYASTFIV